MPVTVDEALLQEVVDNGNELLAVVQQSADSLGNAADVAAQAAAAAEESNLSAEQHDINAGASAAIAISKTTTAPAVKDPVHLIATTNRALSYGSPPIIDGVQTVAGNRVALCVQNNPAENGIYVIGSTSMTRATDADTAAEVANMSTFALLGDKFRGKALRVITSPTTLDTDPLYFAPVDTPLRTPMAQKIGVWVDVGDSNMNGRTAWYTQFPLELTNSGRPLERWTRYNMAQNGSQLHGWVTQTKAASSGSAAPADYTGTTNPYTDLYQVCRANPTIICFRLGINDYNSPANRSGTSGTNFNANMDWAMNFLLWNSNATILLSVPQPYTGIDFVSGSFSTDWAGDASGTAADNAAKWSQTLRAGYLRQAGRSGRILLWDTAEIYCPGVTYDPTLFRCDNPKTSCLDPDAAKVRFQGSITSDVLTVTKLYAGSTLAVGDVITTAGTGTGSGRTIASLGTGTGELGTYNLTSGSDVASTVLKVPSSLLDDSLHFADTAARRMQEHLSRMIGMEASRAIRSFVGSQQGVSPYYDILNAARASWTLYMGTRSKSGSNMLISFDPSPEAVVVNSLSNARRGAGRSAPFAQMTLAEHAMLRENLGKIREVANIRGAPIKLWFEGGSNTIYTASAVSLSSISTDQVFYHNLQFNDIDTTSEPSFGRVIIWIEDSSQLPWRQRQIGATMMPGTAAVASMALPSPFGTSTASVFPIRQVKATRYAATDGAFTIDVGLSNQAADLRLVETSTTKTGTIDDGAGGSGTVLTVANGTGIAVGQTVTGNGATAGTMITAKVSDTVWTVNTAQLRASGTFTFGTVTASAPYTIGQLSFSSTGLVATYTPNQTNIDNANLSLINWAYPAVGTTPGYATFKGNYRLTLVPSITLTKPVNLLISE